MAGLSRPFPLIVARPCHPERDARVKPARDEAELTAWASYDKYAIPYLSAWPSPGANRTMTSLAQPSQQNEVDVRPGLTYATHDGIALSGDLYVPKGAGPFPVLVALHGGGWVQGARSAFRYWGPYLAGRGYALFAISYRLAKAGQKTFP